MHPINKILSLFSLTLQKINKKLDDKERVFREKYEHYYKQVAENNKRGFRVFKDYKYNGGEHPSSDLDFYFEFAAFHIYKEKPKKVLDIGSWRIFLLGLLAHYDLVTIDIRDRKSILNNETIVTCDAKALTFPDNSFDLVMALGSLAHFGLGRYGDEFDLDGDIKAFNEMIRVLRPGGILIFITVITGAEPSILFNYLRIYNYEMIKSFCAGLDCVEEKFYSRRKKRFLSFAELTTEPTFFDVYLGCWRKK